MNKRGALFFTLDTLIAGLMLAFTIVLIFNINIETPMVQDTTRHLSNLVDFLTITEMSKVSFIIYPYNVDVEGVGNLQVHEHIHNLYVEGEFAKLENFTNNIILGTLPESRGVSISIDDETIYIDDRNVINPIINLSMHFITHYVHNDSVRGPNVTTVTIWN